MSESQLQACVIDLAHVYGWKVAHFRPAQTSKGWRTPVGADGKGFVDLVIAAPRREDAIAHQVLFVELKARGGKLSPAQQEWQEWLWPIAAVWTPAEWDDGTIQKVLEAPHKPSFRRLLAERFNRTFAEDVSGVTPGAPKTAKETP